MAHRVISSILVLAIATAALGADSRVSVAPTRQLSDQFKLCCAPEVPAVWDGEAFGVFWTHDAKVLGRRVSRQGEPLSAPLVLRQSGFAPVVASDGERILALTHHRTSLDPRSAIVTSAQFLSRDFRPTEAEVVPIGRAQAAVFDGVNYVVAWTMRYANIEELWLSRLTRSGQVVGTRKVIVDPAAYVFGKVSIATNGTEYVVAWVDAIPADCGGIPCILPTRLRIASMDSRLELTGLKGDIVGPESYHPSVTWTGTQFLLVWTDFYRVYSQRLHPAMPPATFDRITLIEPGHLILGVGAAWDGRHVTVIGSTGFSDGAFYAARLDASGRSLDESTRRRLFSPSTYFTGVTLSGGTEGASLLTYIAGRADYAIYAHRVQSDDGWVMRRAVKR